MEDLTVPLFVYECRDCGQVNEVLVRGEEKPVCPGCGSKRLKKQASAFAAVSGSARQPAETPCSTCPSGGCPYSG